MKITSVLFVDAIAPALEFWVDRMGFEKAVEVPHEDTIGFVILVKDGTDLMLQTYASVRADHAGFLDAPRGRSSSLFISVDDLEDVRRRLAGAGGVMPERTTFYGMREIWVRTPGDHLVGFAAPVK